MQAAAPPRALWGNDPLAEREELLREAERIAHVGSWAWDMRTGKVAWSDELYRILGQSPSATEATFDRFIEAIHPDDRSAVHALAMRASSGDLAAHADYRVLRPDGTVRDVIGIAQIFRAADGTPHRMVGVALDVTERRRLESDLARAQKLEALGRLAGGIAHDFNNLLSIILLNVDVVRRRARDLGLPEDALANAHAAAAEGAQLTKQLLAFSHHSPGYAIDVDVNEAVNNAMMLVGTLLSDKITPRFRASEAPVVVRADPSQLRQIVVNLAMNARDAMPDGGELCIETSVVTRIDGDRVARSYVRLDVQDTGIGMDEATRSRLFEPFFTTKESGKGTGLGLATVFGIVSQRGGMLEVQTSPGRGSTFSAFLPRLDESQSG